MHDDNIDELEGERECEKKECKEKKGNYLEILFVYGSIFFVSLNTANKSIDKLLKYFHKLHRFATYHANVYFYSSNIRPISCLWQND